MCVRACVCVYIFFCFWERDRWAFAGDDVSFSILYLRMMSVKKCRVFLLFFSYKCTWQKKTCRVWLSWNPSRQSAHYRVFSGIFMLTKPPKTSLLPYRCNWSSSTFVIDIRSQNAHRVPHSLVLKITLKIYVDYPLFTGNGGEETVEKCGRGEVDYERVQIDLWPSNLVWICMWTLVGENEVEWERRLRAGKFRRERTRENLNLFWKSTKSVTFSSYTRTFQLFSSQASKADTHKSSLILRLFE